MKKVPITPHFRPESGETVQPPTPDSTIPIDHDTTLQPADKDDMNSEISAETDVLAAEGEDARNDKNGADENGNKKMGDHGESLGSKTRRDYMRNGGFILFSAVGHEVMEQARHDITPRQITRESISHLSWDSEPSSPSGATLGIVVNDLANQLADMNGGRGNFNEDDPGTFYSRHNVTAQDIAEQGSLSIHQYGFADMDFTWRFAAAIANHVIGKVEWQGDITTEERANMTLNDWANIIETPWFSTLLHDLALTDNGKYGSFGRFPSDYKYETVNDQPPFNRVDSPLVVEVSRNSRTQHLKVSSARLDDTFRAFLRANMKENDSAGCPVARQGGVLSTERVASDPHAQALIANGFLKTTDLGNDKTRFEQNQTPISVGLQALAEHLRNYDALYGTPRHLVASMGAEHPRTSAEVADI